MKTVNRCLIFLMISTGLVIAGCNVKRSVNYDIISFSGAAWAGNFSSSYYIFGTSTISKDSPEVKLVAAPGDLLYITDDEGERPIYYHYEGNGHKSFDLEYTENSILINGSTYCYLLGSDSATWAQFSAADPETIRQLKYMDLNGKLTDFQLTILEKFRDYYSGIGLVLESCDSTELFVRLIKMMKPSWLVMQDTYPGPVEEDLAESLAGLKLLWGEADAISETNLLDFCPNIEQLMVADYKDQYALPFNKLTGLKSLSLEESSIRDFSSILIPPGLSRFQLIMNDTVVDISGLKKIRTLSSLSFAGSEINDITFLNNLPQMQFLSLPANITQEEFNLVMQDQRTTEILELYACDSIHDLSVLKDHYKLKAISVNLTDIDLSALYGLTEVELIILDESLWENKDDVEALKSALPDTDIYPGNGLCLGSGWILLIIPFLFIIRYRNYLIKKRK